MNRPRGRPRNEEIQRAVEAAINHLQLGNVSLVRAEVQKLLRRSIGWDTIYHNLESLRDDNKIQKQIMAQFGRRKVYVYLAK
jgi:hypothetical protein